MHNIEYIPYYIYYIYVYVYVFVVFVHMMGRATLLIGIVPLIHSVGKRCVAART